MPTAQSPFPLDLPTDPASVTALAAALVRIPSVNPEAAPDADAQILGEERLALALARWLEPWADSVELHSIEPGRPNLLAKFAADRPGKPRLLLAPHLDTVPVTGMTIDPFGGEIREGRLWGRGACDTKGPMAAMLWALRELHRRGELAGLPWEIHFAAFMGEEVRQPGSTAFAQAHAAEPENGDTFALIGEPTGRQLIHAHKGNSWIELRASGRAAHASRPELGENAIWRLLAALEDLRRHWWPEWSAAESHPLLGLPVWNLGQISGGTRPNIVPDQARATLNLRLTHPRPVGPQIQDWLTQRGHRIQVAESDYSPPLQTPRTDPGLQRLHLASGCTFATAPWFCDAGTLADVAGIPAAAWGPGSIDQAHTADEWIEVAELEASVSDLLAMLRGTRR